MTKTRSRSSLSWQPNPLQMLTLLGVVVGLILGSFFPFSGLYDGASLLAETFVKLLKLLSLPMIFLSLTSAFAAFDNRTQARDIGGRIITYTLFTTMAAASIALLLYLAIDPAASSQASSWLEGSSPQLLSANSSQGYWRYLLDSLPTNIFSPFMDNNIFGVLFLALLMCGALVSLPQENRQTLRPILQSLFAVILKITSAFLYLMPLAVTAFVILFVRDIKAGLNLDKLFFYTLCIIGANLAQALLFLPALLAAKGLSPYKLMHAMAPALTLAFFSKSSAATLPMALQCAEKRAGIDSQLARFAFPLCTTINMNACAGFILITVLFVSELYGVSFSAWDYGSWIFMATIAAIGNAAVPMGCYFLASSFLAAQNLPLHLMGVILPLYTLLDMLETAINVWSDACVTAIAQKDLQTNNSAPKPSCGIVRGGRALF